MCISELGYHSSDSGLSSVCHQAITWTSTELLLIKSLEFETNSSEISLKYNDFHKDAFENIVC